MKVKNRVKSIVCRVCGYHGNPILERQESYATLIVPTLVAFFAAAITFVIVVGICFVIDLATAWTVVLPVIITLVGVIGGFFLSALVFGMVQLWALQRFFKINASRMKLCPECGGEEIVPSSSPNGQRYIREHMQDGDSVRTCGCGYMGRYIQIEPMSSSRKVLKGVGLGLMFLWIIAGSSCVVAGLKGPTPVKMAAQQTPVENMAPNAAKPGAKSTGNRRKRAQLQVTNSPVMAPARDPLNESINATGRIWSLFLGLFTIFPIVVSARWLVQILRASRRFEICPSCNFKITAPVG